MRICSLSKPKHNHFFFLLLRTRIQAFAREWIVFFFFFEKKLHPDHLPNPILEYHRQFFRYYILKKLQIFFDGRF